ncbi:MAG TPA: DinB family protein [Gemmatimonadaceae bacterium]|nr:DinB family protein [Gemmatimonadaceae bacterium]
MTVVSQSVRAQRPEADEFTSYYARYIDRVPDGDIVRTLDEQIIETLALLASVPEERGGFRYAEGKWSIRQVVGHMCDVERIFVYRATRFARNDRTELPGFDENDYVANARFDDRTLAGLADELEAVRWASVALFDSLSDDEFLRRGVANHAPASVRALAWIAAGHEQHHVNILRTRYLTA